MSNQTNIANEESTKQSSPATKEVLVAFDLSLNKRQTEVLENLSTFIEFNGESDIPVAHQYVRKNEFESCIKPNSEIPVAHQYVKDPNLPSYKPPTIVDAEIVSNSDAKIAEKQPEGLDLTLPPSEHRLPTNVEVNITNVVCAYNLSCRVNLIDIVKRSHNVEIKLDQVYLRMRIRKPAVTATIWNSGSVSVMGATNETEAYIAARRIARIIQKLGYPVRMHNFRIVNVAASCIMPWAIRLQNFINEYPTYCSFEPELVGCVIYHMPEPKACFFIFPTGSVNLTAKSIEGVHSALNKLYRQLRVFTKPRTMKQISMLREKDMRLKLDSVNALLKMMQE